MEQLAEEGKTAHEPMRCAAQRRRGSRPGAATCPRLAPAPSPHLSVLPRLWPPLPLCRLAGEYATSTATQSRVLLQKFLMLYWWGAGLPGWQLPERGGCSAGPPLPPRAAADCAPLPSACMQAQLKLQRRAPRNDHRHRPHPGPHLLGAGALSAASRGQRARWPNLRAALHIHRLLLSSPTPVVVHTCRARLATVPCL